MQQTETKLSKIFQNYEIQIRIIEIGLIVMTQRTFSIGGTFCQNISNFTIDLVERIALLVACI